MPVMPWLDEEWVMISALEHYVYCPRRCALIHLECLFEDNVFTLRGRMEHERVDEEESMTQDGVVTQYALPLVSLQLGIMGRADAVEFHPDGRVYPVEYKHGRKTWKGKLHDKVQLAAQAMCLEEMLKTCIDLGAVFYRSSARRQEVEIGSDLREQTKQVITDVRTMLLKGKTPAPVNDKRCPNCSLIEVCQPELLETLARGTGNDKLFMPLNNEGLD